MMPRRCLIQIMVLMGAMHGQSSGFLSLSMPNTFSMGWNYVKKYIAKEQSQCVQNETLSKLFEIDANVS